MRITRQFSRPMAPVLAVGAILSLTGCDSGGLARTFGLVRDAPDEFTVTTQAPLSMPPDFSLRPPRPGAPRPQARSERLQAQEALIPQLALGGQGNNAGATAGQSALLDQVGPTAAPDIRQRVDQDARLEQANDGFLDRILSWRKSDPQAVEVDPDRENQRLRQNAALGQGADVGATPTINTKPRTWFQKMLGWF